VAGKLVSGGQAGGPGANDYSRILQLEMMFTLPGAFATGCSMVPAEAGFRCSGGIASPPAFFVGRRISSRRP
jgi:hypothetical protein